MKGGREGGRGKRGCVVLFGKVGLRHIVRGLGRPAGAGSQPATGRPGSVACVSSIRSWPRRPSQASGAGSKGGCRRRPRRPRRRRPSAFGAGETLPSPRITGPRGGPDGLSRDFGCERSGCFLTALRSFRSGGVLRFQRNSDEAKSAVVPSLLSGRAFILFFPSYSHTPYTFPLRIEGTFENDPQIYAGASWSPNTAH